MWTRYQKLEIGSTTSPPPSTHKIGIWDFSKFELSIKFMKPPLPPPPPPQMGILDFSKFELSIKFCNPPPPPTHTNGNFGF